MRSGTLQGAQQGAGDALDPLGCSLWTQLCWMRTAHRPPVDSPQFPKVAKGLVPVGFGGYRPSWSCRSSAATRSLHPSGPLYLLGTYPGRIRGSEAPTAPWPHLLAKFGFHADVGSVKTVSPKRGGGGCAMEDVGAGVSLVRVPNGTVLTCSPTLPLLRPHILDLVKGYSYPIHLTGEDASEMGSLWPRSHSSARGARIRV